MFQFNQGHGGSKFQPNQYIRVFLRTAIFIHRTDLVKMGRFETGSKG